MMENNTLKEETLCDAKAYTIKVIQGINKYIEYIQDEKVGEYKKMVPLLIDGLEWIINVATLTQDIAKGIDGNKLINVLPALLDAMENDDYVLFGDILNYEVNPILREWIIVDSWDGVKLC